MECEQHSAEERTLELEERGLKLELKRLDRPEHILKAEAGSTCRVPEHPPGLPRVTVETVPGGTHFFPMLKADVARDALFDAAV